jgi:DNA-binding NarL/FixJ family response regulator
VGTDVIGVAVVEDHPLYRRGLIRNIEQAPGMELVASAASLEAMEARGYHDIDVVLLDLHLPDCHGPDLVSKISSRGPAILVVSVSDDRRSVVDAIAAGARGYVSKAADGEEIARAVEVVAEGGTYVSSTLASYLLRDAREDQRSHAYRLSEREREILTKVSQGDTDAEIAEQLLISVRTVHSHLDRIRDKTGRRRRADLTRLAVEDQARQGYEGF